jgi:hypothetical protein
MAGIEARPLKTSKTPVWIGDVMSERYLLHIEHDDVGVALTGRNLDRAQVCGELDELIETLSQRAFANGAASVKITIKREAK